METSLARVAAPVLHPEVQVFNTVAALPEAALALMRERAVSEACLQFGPDWFANLEQTVFQAGSGVEYATLWQGNQVRAVVPILVERSAFNTVIRALGNYYTCLYEPAFQAGLTAGELACLFRWLRRRHWSVSSLTLSPLATESPAFELIQTALDQSGWRTFKYFCFGNWYQQVRDSWPEYLSSREGKLRSTIKRMSQRIQNEGGRVEILTGEGDVERGIAAYNAVYAKSWKVPEPSEQFMPGLIRACARTGTLRLGIVWMGELPVAAQLWIVLGHRAEIYKLAYDEAFKHCSPGTVLTTRLMQHVREVDGVTEIDYLIGDDPYKASWMSQRRERWGLVAFNRWSPWGLLLGTLESVKRLIRPARPA